VKVAELTAYHVRIALRRPVRHASHSRSDTDNVLVRCVLADGIEGWGESVPREYVTGETAAGALALLRRSGLPDQLSECADFPAAVAMAERLTLAPVPGDDRGRAGNAARCAAELAVLDAYGRCFHEPLLAVTKLVTPELFQPRPRVRYSGAITSATGLKLRIAAWAMRLYGFKQVKVKVGITGQDDPARLRTVRRRVGPRVELRVDANEAWQPGEVVERVRALEPFRVRCVEQPVPHAEVGTLREVRRHVHVPILLDESLCSLADAERAVDEKLCDQFNLRLSKCGGLIPTLRLASFAVRHGYGIRLGCQVGETAILSAAGRHAACSVGDWLSLEGSFDRHLVRTPLGKKDLTFRWGGWAPALVAPGLGVVIDPAAVERVTVAKEPLLG
jgi:muconate cycloisomerase